MGNVKWLGLSILVALSGAGCATNGDDGTTGAPVGTGGAGVPGAIAGMGAAGVGGMIGGAGAAGVDVGMTAGSGGGVAGTGGMTAGTGGMTAGTGGTTAGTGGTTAGTGGTTGGTGGAGTGGGGDEHMPACISDPSQLVIIGDSYIQWVSHQFPTDLAELGDAVGTWNVAPPGGTMYAVGGTSIGNGQIPGQLTNALRDVDNVKVVVMTGGGNDILLNVLGQGCKATGSSMMQVCKDIVNTAIETSKGMLPGLMAEGVTDMVYFFYPHVPLNTALGGPNPNEMLDYSLPLTRDYCNGVSGLTGGQVKCHFVDMIPVFEGHPEYFATGDLHPNNMGSAAMAAEVWRVMEENCIAKPASSGCCTP